MYVPLSSVERYYKKCNTREKYSLMNSSRQRGGSLIIYKILLYIYIYMYTVQYSDKKKKQLSFPLRQTDFCEIKRHI